MKPRIRKIAVLCLAALFVVGMMCNSNPISALENGEGSGTLLSDTSDRQVEKAKSAIDGTAKETGEAKEVNSDINSREVKDEVPSMDSLEKKNEKKSEQGGDQDKLSNAPANSHVGGDGY